MFKFFIKLFLDEFGGTLSITRKTSNTLITAAGFNTNYDEIEAVVNGGIDADNIDDDAVTAAKINVDVVRADYGLAQHTDGSLYVDVSDTNPGLELSDGGLRVDAYGLNQRTANGLEVGRTGDKIFSSNAAAPDGWTDVSATYSNKFIRINATAESTGGADTHTHGGTTGSHTLTTAEIPAHTHAVYSGAQFGGSGHNFGDANNNGQQYTDTSGSTGSGGGHTHTIPSGDNVPAYVTQKLFSKD